MFAKQDLEMVLRRQEALRRQAQQDRRSEHRGRHGERDSKAHRVFGLRLSIA